MSLVPTQHRPDADLLPPPLRALLEAELAAGNGILEVAHSHPAAPIGVYFKLTGPVTTRARATDSELKFSARNSSLWSGEFTDAKGYCYILEAPLSPPPEPDMDAIREAANAPPPLPPLPTGDSPYQRFVRSMVIDYEKWHDGIGYDLEAIQEAAGDERLRIEADLLRRSPSDWNDVEALAALDTPKARVRGSMHRPGEIAANLASMLLYLHGLQKSQHDWDLRPFWLRFNTDVRSERDAVFRELCEKIGRDPTPFLT